jgi:hypothetical protein
MKIGSISSTGRSINATGTINSNGADYAEYYSIDPTLVGSFTPNPGEICGVNSSGNLTNVYADSISFGIVSTNPSFVGGDKANGTDGNNNMSLFTNYVTYSISGRTATITSQAFTSSTASSNATSGTGSTKIQNISYSNKYNTSGASSEISRIVPNSTTNTIVVYFISPSNSSFTTQLNTLKTSTSNTATSVEIVTTYNTLTNAVSSETINTYIYTYNSSLQTYSTTSTSSAVTQNFNGTFSITGTSTVSSNITLDSTKTIITSINRTSNTATAIIALCGRTPLTVSASNTIAAGDFIVPSPTSSGGITFTNIKQSNLTLQGFCSCLGKIVTVNSSTVVTVVLNSTLGGKMQ